MCRLTFSESLPCCIFSVPEVIGIYSQCSGQPQQIDVMTAPIDSATIQKALRDSKEKEQFQKILCVWLKFLFSLNSRQIGMALGLKPSSVRSIQARFETEGLQCFRRHRKGGRRRENMSFDREANILEKFARRARRGFALDVKQIQKVYELSVGKPVARSTIYRLIVRHGLRRFLPKARTL